MTSTVRLLSTPFSALWQMETRAYFPKSSIRLPTIPLLTCHHDNCKILIMADSIALTTAMFAIETKCSSFVIVPHHSPQYSPFSILLFLWYNSPDSTLRVLHVAGISWNEMHVAMIDTLACCLTNINANIVSVRMETLIYNTLDIL